MPSQCRDHEHTLAHLSLPACWEWNSDSHARTANRSPTEPSRQPPLFPLSAPLQLCDKPPRDWLLLSGMDSSVHSEEWITLPVCLPAHVLLEVSHAAFWWPPSEQCTHNIMHMILSGSGSSFTEEHSGRFTRKQCCCKSSVLFQGVTL